MGDQEVTAAVKSVGELFKEHLTMVPMPRSARPCTGAGCAQ